MELHRLPSETLTSSSRGFRDQLYDNCPPYSLRRRGEEWHGDGGGGAAGRPAPAGGLPAAPRGPPVGLAPAAAHVPTPPAGAGVSGSGAWPDHSHCSWGPGGPGRRGSRAAEAGRRWGDDRREEAGGGGPGRDGEGSGEGDGEEMRRPSPAHSAQHRSALSLYDNLRDGATPDGPPATPMETSILFPYSEGDSFLFARSEEDLRPTSAEDDGGGGGGASRYSSPWSSCEIILADGRSSEALTAEEQPGGPEDGGPSEASLPYSSQTGPLDRHRWPPAGADPAGADPGPDPGPDPGVDEAPPRRGERVPPPVPPADPVASALRSVLTGLQHQMGRQRAGYEARISSLEQRNEELQGQLLGLRADLSQQRRWYQAVQARIRESERARAAAESRNAAIQREMEQFFDTFGELNDEAKKAERIVRSF